MVGAGHCLDRLLFACPPVAGWMGSTVQRPKCSSAISKSAIGFYFIPESLWYRISAWFGVPRSQGRLQMVGDEAGKVD